MKPTLAVVAPERFLAQGLVGIEGIESVSVLNVSKCPTGLPAGTTGLLIYAPDDQRVDVDISRLVDEAFKIGIPILGSAGGSHTLNVALGGDDAEETPCHVPYEESDRQRNSIFLAPGAKVSSTIGGSGWLSINCHHHSGISQASLAPETMASAIADDRIVEAFEMPGHRWVIGVQWDIFGATRLPRGFDSVWLAFIERVAGK